MDKAIALLLILAGLTVPALQAELSLIVLEYSLGLSLLAFIAVGAATIIAFCIAAKQINWCFGIKYKTIAMLTCLPAMILYPLVLYGMMSFRNNGLGIVLLIWACIICEIYDAVLLGLLLSKAKDDCL